MESGDTYLFRAEQGTGHLRRLMSRRFHGAAKLDPKRVGRDAAKIAEEIVQHLTSMIGVEVEITLEIQAHIPDGASPDVVRTITEYCRTLKFMDHGFEEE